MTITNITCIELTCSGCGAEIEIDGTTCHFADIASARAQSAEYDWWNDGADIDVCDDCKTYPHPFAPATEGDSYCSRCMWMDDEHDATDPVVPPNRRQSGPDLLAEATA